MSTVGPDKRLNYYRLSPEAVIKELGSHKMGLTNVEAARRLRAHGPNILSTSEDNSRLVLVAQACCEPVVILLLAGIILTVFTGDLAVRVVLLALAIANIAAIATLNHRRAIPSSGLAYLLPATAKVIRNGDEHTVETATLVIGDIVSLHEGDVVPADVRIIEEADFSTDDAPLTGDHSLNHKSVAAPKGEVPLFLRHTIAYMGTRVATGKARGVVVATGMQAELGRVVALTAATQQHVPRFQAQFRRIANRAAQTSVAVSVTAGVLGFAAGMPVVASLRLVLLILVAATPLSLVLELFIIRLENREQLTGMHLHVQALSALDALASTDIVIIDQAAAHAGNTANATHVLAGRAVYTTEGHGYDPAGKILGMGEQEITGPELDKLALLFTAAALTSNAKVYQAHSRRNEWRSLGNSVDAAILTLARRGGIHTESLHDEYERLGRLVPSGDHTFVTGIFKHGGETVLFARGGVTAIASRSKKFWDHNHVRNFTKGDLAYLHDHTESESLGARHTAALAYCLLPKNYDPKTTNIDDLSQDLTFLGVVSIHTPLHEMLPEALSTLRATGIAVSMIVNDDPPTARAIARHAGIVAAHVSGMAVTSADLHGLDDAQVLQYLEKGGVTFSRLSPEDTLRLVEISEAAGHATTLTGHGVSDLPALAHASAGITITENVGQHLVSAPHGSALAGAVSQGRLAYACMRQAIKAVLVDNAAFVALIFLGIAGQIIYNQPIPIQVMQIILFSTLIQALPIIELAWDKPLERAMQQRPKLGMLISPNDVGEIVIFGLLAGAVAYANFLLYFARINLSPAYIDPSSAFVAHAATIAFVTLVACQSANLLFLRAARHQSFFTRYLWSNPRLLAAMGLGTFVVLIVVYNPTIAQLFNFAGLDPGDWAMVAIATAAYIGARLLQRHTRQHARHTVIKLHRKVYGKNSGAKI